MHQQLHPPLHMAFLSEGTAKLYEMAVDHLLGWDLITERHRTLVTIFYADDEELREDLLESAHRMGGHELRFTRQ
jgi:hypothetical protein